MTVIRSFELPMLGLLDAQSIVDSARTESRILNGASKALEVTHIHSESTSALPFTPSEGNLSRAAIAFSSLDSTEDGLLPLNALKPVFFELGSDFLPDDVEAIAKELELDMCTSLSFQEVTDMAAYLLTNSHTSSL